MFRDSGIPSQWGIEMAKKRVNWVDSGENGNIQYDKAKDRDVVKVIVLKVRIRGMWYLLNSLE
jgi:hypothetical protein